MSWVFGMFSFSIFCFGGFVFWFIEWVRVDIAKSPVRSGSSGFCVEEFRVAIPRIPASVKIMVACIFDFFSFAIRNIVVQIRMNAIICWIVG